MATIKGKVIDHYSNEGLEDAYVSVIEKVLVTGIFQQKQIRKVISA